jgi:hypothetical protein
MITSISNDDNPTGSASSIIDVFIHESKKKFGLVVVVVEERYQKDNDQKNPTISISGSINIFIGRQNYLALFRS